MTLAHPKRSIKNHAIMFWNATFAHAEVLNYPENLRYSKIVKSHCKDKRNGDGDGVYAGGENRSSYDDNENDDI